MKLLMVCLGNICRSPMAQGILESKVQDLALDWEIDSAGTSGWHIGEKPDHRAIEVCLKHGINISNQRSRKIDINDFSRFDWIFTMDNSNYNNVINISPDPQLSRKVKPLLSFIPNIYKDLEVPDPYFKNNFEEVFNLLDQAIDFLILQLSEIKPDKI